MRLGRLLLASAAAWALLSAPAWTAAEQPKFSVQNEVPDRPELDVLSGVKAWRVNGEEIPLNAVQNRAMLYHGPFVLQDMVQERLLLQEAKRRGVTVSESEVDARVKSLRDSLGLQSDAAFNRYLRAQRVTSTAFRETARDYVYVEKVLGDAVYVSDDEVQRAYTQFQESYRRPESASLRLMTFGTEAAAQAAKAELVKGRSFEEVAKATATVPVEKANPGALVLFQRGITRGASKELEEAIFAAPLNQVTGPIRVREGVVLLKVEKKLDARQITLDEIKDTLKAQIRRTKLESEIWPSWISGQIAAAEIVPVKAE
jgi:foldase protein PrsA